VSCDDFGDCHDKIIVAHVDFIVRRPICGLYLQEEGCFWTYEESDSGSSISSLMVAERKLRSRGDESTSYVVPDDATADILSAI
jgi:hypothetical protein